MNNLISIIVPIFNVQDYLSKCLDSLVRQTYKNIEIILVDDGSTDASGDICKKFASLDSRIKIISKANQGLSSARNDGIRIATGEYIFFVDSDDYIALDTVAYMYGYMIKHREVDMALFNYRDVFMKDSKLSKNICKNPIIKDAIWSEHDFWNAYYLINNVFCTVAWNKIYKKKLFENLRYKNGMLNEDELIIRSLVKKCNKIGITHRVFYYYVQRVNSITRGLNNKIRSDAVIDELIERNNYFLKAKEYSLVEKNTRLLLKTLSDNYQSLTNQQSSKINFGMQYSLSLIHI